MRNFLILALSASIIFSNFSFTYAQETNPKLKIERYVYKNGDDMKAKVYLEDLSSDTMAFQIDFQTSKSNQYDSIEWNADIKKEWAYLQQSEANSKGQITLYIVGDNLPSSNSLYLGEITFKDKDVSIETEGTLKYLEKVDTELVTTDIQKLNIELSTTNISNNRPIINTGTNSNDKEEESTTDKSISSGSGSSGGSGSSSSDRRRNTNDDKKESSSSTQVAENNNKATDKDINKDTIKFSDVENHWAKSSIFFAVANGYISGMGNGKFAPDDTMTRAMLVRILYNTETKIQGKEPEGETLTFSDVPQDAWFATAVSWSASNGIVYGVGNDEFAPNRAITREEMVTLLKRYADFKKLSLPVVKESVNFNDAQDISQWALDSVEAMQKADIVNGKGNNLFEPKSTSTRAEVATAFERFSKTVLNIK